MILIISELKLDEIKTIDLYDYLYNGKGFFDLTRGNKRTVVDRIKSIASYYRFFSTVPLNFIIITDKEWNNISPDQFKTSSSIACWCDVPEYGEIDKRLDDSQIVWSDSDIDNLMESVSKINFKTANLNIQLELK